MEVANYKLLVTGASIAPLKRTSQGEEPWDVGSAPDAYVVIEVCGETAFISPPGFNTFEPRWLGGTAYMTVNESAPVRVALVDTDVGKYVQAIGALGVTFIPNLGVASRQIMSKVIRAAPLASDDPIAVWQGTFRDLLAAAGGAGKAGSLRPVGPSCGRWQSDCGLTSLDFMVIRRPADFDPISPPKGREQCLGIRSVRAGTVKGGSKEPWDVGLGAIRSPDIAWLLFVNGDAVQIGHSVSDSCDAHWTGDLHPLYLLDEDIVTLLIVDADAGTALAKVASADVIGGMSASKLLLGLQETWLKQFSSDDCMYVWSGRFLDLKRMGMEFRLPVDPAASGVKLNDGVEEIVLSRGHAPESGEGAPSLSLDLQLRSARVCATKANGEAWDAFGGRKEPDLFAAVSVAGNPEGWILLGRTSVFADCMEVSWDHRISDPRLRSGVRVKIEVYDADIASDDLVGSLVTVVPEKEERISLKGHRILDLSAEWLSPE